MSYKRIPALPRDQTANKIDKSAKGRKVLNEILGYRNFLWSVEVDRLSKDVKNHPESYPYAVAFGLMDDWVIYIQSQCAIRVSRNDHN